MRQARAAALLFLAGGVLGCDSSRPPNEVQSYDAGLAPAAPPCSPDGGPGLCTLASGQDLPNGLAVTGDNVYWTNLGSLGGAGAVVRIPQAGGSPETIVSRETAPGDIAVNPGETAVFWTTLLGSNASATGGAVLTTTPSSGQATAVATNQSEPDAIAVDASHLYWTDLGTQSNNFEDGTVLESSLGGSNARTLASAQSAPRFLSVDSANVYWTCSSETGTVVRFPLSGSAPVTMATGQANPESVAAANGSLYWVNRGTKARSYEDGSLVRAPLSGGTPSTILTQLPDPYVMALDGSNVYYANANGTILRISEGGGAPVMMTWGQGEIVTLAVDSTSLYWTDQTNGTVMKLTPK
jgi:hypothetical protein